jgi:hypothetical protein
MTGLLNTHMYSVICFSHFCYAVPKVQSVQFFIISTSIRFTPIILRNLFFYLLFCGPGSSVGIATGHGLDGPRIEFRWGDFPHLSRSALGPTQPPVQWVPGLSGGVTLTPHPF